MSREKTAETIRAILEDAEMGVSEDGEGNVLVFFRDQEVAGSAQVHEFDPFGALKLSAAIVACAEKAMQRRREKQGKEPEPS